MPEKPRGSEGGWEALAQKARAEKPPFKFSDVVAEEVSDGNFLNAEKILSRLTKKELVEAVDHIDRLVEEYKGDANDASDSKNGGDGKFINEGIRYLRKFRTVIIENLKLMLENKPRKR